MSSRLQVMLADLLALHWLEYYIYFDQPRKKSHNSDAMQGAYLGPEFSDQ